MFQVWRFIGGIRWRTLVATWRILGFSREFFVRLFVLPLAGWFVEFLMALDHIFYPAIRKARVERPVFIVAHPRSGTTFLHRLLSSADDFVVFRAWEIMLPSLVGRKIFRRTFERRMKTGAGFFPKEVGHEVTLASVEEEELLFLHIGNTQFMTILTPLGFSEWDFAPLVFCDDQPPAVQRYTAHFLRKCLQRQIVYLGKTQVLSKLNYSAMRLRSLMKAFQDARVIYLVRSPLETIPSHLTLHRNMLDHHWGLENLPADGMARYFQRRYRYDVALYRHMEDLIEQGALPESQLLVLPYERLRASPLTVAKEVAEFAGLKLSDAAWEEIRRQDSQQKTFQREHRNLTLEEFGLTRETIVHDLGFVFDKYGFPK
jgi:hypothetical protein